MGLLSERCFRAIFANAKSVSLSEPSNQDRSSSAAFLRSSHSSKSRASDIKSSDRNVGDDVVPSSIILTPWRLIPVNCSI